MKNMNIYKHKALYYIKKKYLSLAVKAKNNRFAHLNDDYSRHTLDMDHSSLFYIPRETAIQTMKRFTADILPKIETFVEMRLLEDIKENMTPLEKEEMQDAYNLRRTKANILTKKEIELDKSNNQNDGNIQTFTFDDLFSSLTGTGLNKLSYKDIGKYIHFPSELKRKYFPTGFYGEYINFEYKISQSVNLMVREETLNLISYLNFRRNESERKPMIKEITNNIINLFSESEVVDVLDLVHNKFNYYSLIYQEISSDINSILNENKLSNKYELRFLLTSADIYDGLINQIISNFNDAVFTLVFMCFPKTRQSILIQILNEFKNRFAMQIQLKNSHLKTLDHRLSEKDIITYQFFYQIQKVLKSIDVKVDKKVMLDELSQYKDINNEEFIKNNLPESFNLKLDNRLIYSKDVIPLNKDNYDGWKRPTKQEITLSDEEIERRKKSFNTNNEDAFDPFFSEDPFKIKNFYTGYRGFNSGTVLFGESGSGKSCIMAHLHSWAKENNWVVLPIYRASRFTIDMEDIEQHLNGLYLQNELVKELLIEFKVINIKLLEKMKVNLEKYGKFNTAGVKDGEPDPVPVLWDEGRRVFTDSWKIFDPDEEAFITKYSPNQLRRMSDFFLHPKSALDIINYGIENIDFATNAFAEVLSMLCEDKEVKTMILVDEYNEWFRLSEYLSYKYANRHKHRIPPYTMALVRLLMSLDGHLSYNVFKVFGLSQSRYQRHKVDPAMLNLSYNFSTFVSNLKLNDVRYAVRFYNYIGLCYDIMPESEILYLYTVSQGNWKELQKFCKFPCKIVPSHMAYIERKITQRAIDQTNMEIKKFLLLKAKEKNKKVMSKVQKFREVYSQYDQFI